MLRSKGLLWQVWVWCGPNEEGCMMCVGQVVKMSTYIILYLVNKISKNLCAGHVPRNPPTCIRPCIYMSISDYI